MKLRPLSLFFMLSLTCLLSACSFTDPELVYLENFKITQFSKEGVEFSVKAKVNNPNNYRVSLVSSKLDIFINDEPMGKATLKRKIHFRANSTESYTIELINKPENFAKLGVVSLVSLLGKQKMKITVKGDVKGRVRLVGKKFPVDFTEHVSL